MSRPTTCWKACMPIRSSKPTPAEISRQLAGFISGYVEVINRETGEVYDPKEFRQVSDRAIRMFLNSWGSSSATSRKRTGNRQLRLCSFCSLRKIETPRLCGRSDLRG